MAKQNYFCHFLAVKSNLLACFRRAITNPVEHVKDILIQEIMTLEKSTFEQEAIDMDSISFAGKKHNIFAEKILRNQWRNEI